MRVDDVVVEVRDPDLARVAAVDLGGVVSARFVKRYNAVGLWRVTLPTSEATAGLLATPGWGVLVWVRGRPFLSGPTVDWLTEESAVRPEGLLTVNGVDDMVLLADATARPTPSAPPEAQGDAYDVASGPLESVWRHYVDVNVGPAARGDRRGRLTSHLTLDGDDQERGPHVHVEARFDQLGKLLADAGTTGGGTMRFDVVQSGTARELRFRVSEVRDRRAEVRFSVAADTLDSTAAGVSAPTLTSVTVAGQGQGEERTFREVTSPAAAAAADLWGRRVEGFLDQRQTDDADQLDAAGYKELAERGDSTVTLRVQASDEEEMVYGRDWREGDRVGVVVAGQVLDDVVTEAAVEIKGDGGVMVAATVGDPAGFDWEAAVTRLLAGHGTRLDALERRGGTAS